MDAIGGGVLVAAAAALWIAYLLPSWLRRRQYLATERNAVRLQQTLRILAETAETPEPVRVEATAREVATQQRILHEHEAAARLTAEAAEHRAIAERRAAEGEAESARRLAASAHSGAPVTEPIPVVTASTDAADAGASQAQAHALRARRALRRKRGLCSLLMLASLITVVGGLIAAAFGASLLIAAGGGLGLVVAFVGIVGLARVRLPAVVHASAVERETVPFEPIETIEPAEPASAEHGWTPQPLPRPLHLSRGTIAAMAMASVEAAAELKRADAAAEVARRAQEIKPSVPTIAPAAATAATAGAAATPARPDSAAAPVARRAEPVSPYAQMGIVGETRPGFDDLDAVLRRRRQAV
jgi:hypothetical protein